MSSCSTTNSSATVEDTAAEPTTELVGELEQQTVATDPMLVVSDPSVSVADDEGGDSEPEADPIAASAETSGRRRCGP